MISVREVRNVHDVGVARLRLPRAALEEERSN
jgi:hypothetical protein